MFTKATKIVCKQQNFFVGKKLHYPTNVLDIFIFYYFLGILAVQEHNIII